MTQRWVIDAADLEDVKRLAQRLVLYVRPGDWILLEGELGAGKTTFARLFIQALLGPDDVQEVASPTFSILQSYDTARMTVQHFDLYRLESAGEALELGLGQDDQAVTLVEWPDRLDGDFPASRLEISFQDNMSDGGDCADDERHLTLRGYGAFDERLSRLRLLSDFLNRGHWGDAAIFYMQGDASARCYARLNDNGRRAILMDSPAAPDGPPVRDGKSYSEVAQIAENVTAFVAVAEALKRSGIVVPEIIEQDLETGFLIIGDLGNNVFGQMVEGGACQETLWRDAVDVLVALRRHRPTEVLPVGDGAVYSLSRYDIGALAIETELLMDWYWPWAKKEEASAAQRRQFMKVWLPVITEISAEDRHWVLRDFHSPNLIHLRGDGVRSVGVIDFQDAVRGHAAYDLVSLLQDARLDVVPALEESLLAYYCDTCAALESDFDAGEFKKIYAMFGVQRNTKILGIFARLALRDEKAGYLAHVPRVWEYLRRNLAHEALSDLRHWYYKNFAAALSMGDRGENS